MASSTTNSITVDDGNDYHIEQSLVDALVRAGHMVPNFDHDLSEVEAKMEEVLVNLLILPGDVWWEGDFRFAGILLLLSACAE